jgi:alkaline phosphatase
VPVGNDLIRTSYIAGHTDAHVAQILERFEQAGRLTGFLSSAEATAAADAAAAQLATY